ncbi:MAG TPA: MFS transporter [Candidatus Binatia bacterium]|nr:MFS transporter [Candidatus Binatia bacterium]
MDEHNSTPLPKVGERDYQRLVNAWAMYDWANSAFAVIILTAVFPVYYRSLVINAGHSPAEATAYWAYTTSVSMLIVALAGPVLGAMADLVGGTKRFLGVALGLGVLGSAGLAFLGKDTFLLGSLIFAVGNLGFAGGNIFYEAWLPHLARPGDIDRVSARGYALGYLGGGLLLIITTLWLLWPSWLWVADRDSALRGSFVSVAVWWLVFALPLFRTVPAPGTQGTTGISMRLAISSFQRPALTLSQIRRYRQLAIFLAAFWLYNDGINTIIKIATAYGDEIGIDHNHMLLALILTQLIGFPSTLGFGALAGYLGAKGAILAGLAAYGLISIAGFFMKSPLHFYVLAAVVGLVQGGTQALSRSLFATMVPKARSGEFFGFFSTGEKFAGIIGPAIFGFVGQLMGSSRWGIISVTLLFVAGAALLWRVDEQEGRRIAGEVDVCG